MMNPDCRDGKHRACSGTAWDDERDELVACPCSCHGEPSATAKPAQGHEGAVQVGPQEDVEERPCVHCGEPLSTFAQGGLFVHARGLQRCQSSAVPYGHMGHPEMPCPPGEINPCLGYREGDCTHLATPAPVSSPAGEDVERVARVLASWGLRSGHGEWSDEETQRNAARDVLAALSARAVEAQEVERVHGGMSAMYWYEQALARGSKAAAALARAEAAEAVEAALTAIVDAWREYRANLGGQIPDYYRNRINAADDRLRALLDGDSEGRES